MLDGEHVELLGVGFAGVKGFGGGFGVHALQAWGEELIRSFVQEAVTEALKLETAIARLRTEHRVALLHYAPIDETIRGEAPEIHARFSGRVVSRSLWPGIRRPRSSMGTRIMASPSVTRGLGLPYTTSPRPCSSKRPRPVARSTSSSSPPPPPPEPPPEAAATFRPTHAAGPERGDPSRTPGLLSRLREAVYDAWRCLPQG